MLPTSKLATAAAAGEEMNSMSLEIQSKSNNIAYLDRYQRNEKLARECGYTQIMFFIETSRITDFLNEQC